MLVSYLNGKVSVTAKNDNCCILCDEGNSEIRSELSGILHGGQFDFTQLIDYLHDESRDSQVRWRAGAALAAFSYNSVANQRSIADCAASMVPPDGGILYDVFNDFMSPSQDDVIRCWTAFQVLHSYTVSICICVDRDLSVLKRIIEVVMSNQIKSNLFVSVACIARLHSSDD